MRRIIPVRRKKPVSTYQPPARYSPDFIPKCVVGSEAYRTLSLVARAILVEIVATFDGHNNGAIHISYAQLAARLNRKNQAPIGPAIAELMQHGLLDLSAESIWRERKAREYRITFANTSDIIGRTIPATNDYLKFDATDVVAAKRKTATTSVAEGGEAATASVAVANGKLPKTQFGSATTGVVPISKPYAAAKSEAGETLNPDPQIVDDPNSVGADTAELRGRITSYWRGLSPKRQRAWAEAHGLTRDDIKAYCIADPDRLPAPKVAAMVLAIRNEKAANRLLAAKSAGKAA